MQKVIGYIQAIYRGRFTDSRATPRTVLIARALVACSCAVLASANVRAHEFWIQPEQYLLEPGQRLRADLKVGQQFSGESMPYFEDQFVRFSVHCGDRSEPVRSRFASIPAVSQRSLCPGLNVLVYESRPSFVTYDTADKFTGFLDYEGLDGVLERHRERGLPAQGFKEAFRRFSKTLVWQRGDAAMSSPPDQQQNLLFEWVVETSPYPDAQTFKAQLLLDGKPYIDAQARLFIRRDDAVQDRILRTDTTGRITISLGRQGEYLINAVHMREIDGPLAKATGAVWESLWASVSFYVDGSSSGQ